MEWRELDCNNSCEVCSKSKSCDAPTLRSAKTKMINSMVLKIIKSINNKKK